MPSVLQDWVLDLTLMQQSVLITACRGPDTLHKNHVAKVVLRWLRRCFLYSAFEKTVFTDPYQEGGGSFTGPCPKNLYATIDAALDEYLKSCDEIPHHFHLHFIHASEIIGYKHPDKNIASWWSKAYLRMVHDMHLQPETERQMDNRLGDNIRTWRENEEVVAE